jgi:hypothetical protein
LPFRNADRVKPVRVLVDLDRHVRVRRRSRAFAVDGIDRCRRTAHCCLALQPAAFVEHAQCVLV